LHRGNAYHRHRQTVNRPPQRGQSRDGSAEPMAPFETITIDATVAACDGGEGALGHPKVYLNLAPSGKAECPYCSRLFVNPTMHEAGGADRIGDTGPPPPQAPVPGA
jgi:uncharacterized Zn-finger protein